MTWEVPMRGAGARVTTAVTLSAGAGLLLAAVPPIAAAQERPQEIRTAAPATPIQVRLRLGETPVPGDPFTVALQVHADEAAPDTRARIALPAGAVVRSGRLSRRLDLAARQTRTVSVTAEITRTGNQTIEGTALRRIGAGESWGDIDQKFFTAGDSASVRGFRAAPDASLRTRKLSARTTLAPAAAATGTFGICWRYVNRLGGQSLLRDALVLLYDKDSTGADDLLRQSATNASGCVSFAGVGTRDTDAGGAIDPYVQVRTVQAGRYRVETYAGSQYSCTSSVTANASRSHSFGTWSCGSTSGAGRALPVFDDIYLMRRFIMEQAVNRGYGSTPANCTVRWQAGGTQGTYYSRLDGRVYLVDAAARSRDTVVHECAHRQMEALYGSYPTANCPTPHYLTRVSNKVCAWTEGWTYVIVAGVDGNPLFTFPSGAVTNLETPNCTTPDWDDGPQVEGRIGGTLIDLMDPFTLSYTSVTGFSNETSPCGGNDDVGGQFGHIWDLFSDQNDTVFVAQEGQFDSFSRAWRSRTAAGYPSVRAWWAGNLNSIGTFTRD